MLKFPYETPAILVEQPLGSFYIARLPAKLLLEVTYSDLLTALATNSSERPYMLDGTQRELQLKRLTQIGSYIDRDDSAFPNAIILAANIRPEDGLIEEAIVDDVERANLPGASEEEMARAEEKSNKKDRRWTITEKADGCSILRIPTEAPLAAVVDGQHRLGGFKYTNELARLDMELSCAIYMDLPKPYQAQLFATINSNQKRVDKSQTYELFGYNIDDEPAENWAPDKLAVFLTRRLGADEKSPLNKRITIAPRKDEVLKERQKAADWRVSTAVIVDGIMRLITSNPKRDANLMRTPRSGPRSRLSEEGARKDRSPLRPAFIAGQDAVIYQLVRNYLEACQDVFWEKAKANSFITRTVGVQALFDILRRLAAEAFETKVISKDSFVKKLEGARKIDFSTDTYRNASGSGRSIIRRAIEKETGLEQ